MSLPIHYKGELLPFNYRVDFKCGPILIEAKALEALAPAHLSQIINYLKASRLQRGVLINFGTKSLNISASSGALIARGRGPSA